MSEQGDRLEQRINDREYFQLFLAERDRRLDERFGAQEQAGKKDYLELQRRLETLNHAHETAREKERDFISREVFDNHVQRNQDDHVQSHRELEQTRDLLSKAVVEKAEALALSLSDNTKVSDSRIKTLENFQSKLLGLALAAPFLTGMTVYFITSR